MDFRERAQVWQEEDLVVRVSILVREEALREFGASLYSQGIQPVWLEVENQSPSERWYFPVFTDPDYFSPDEAALLVCRNRWGVNREEVARRFRKLAMPRRIPPGQKASGFVLTTMDPGVKHVPVLLAGGGDHRKKDFILSIPGFVADHRKVTLEGLYGDDVTQCQDPDCLRAAVEALPPCATDRDGTGLADPLNLVLVSRDLDLFPAFVRRGWDPSERVRPRSVLATLVSFLSGLRYRTAPVSAMYLFDRRQDMAFQKVRQTVRERNHLRIWLSPITFRGDPVWVGQISRDIGVHLSSSLARFITHSIDPDIDEARDYLLQDFLLSDSVEAFGYAGGVENSTPENPARNMGGDLYFTDGLRLVVLFGRGAADLSEVEVLPWRTHSD